jgi:hypothetical protein
MARETVSAARSGESVEAMTERRESMRSMRSRFHRGQFYRDENRLAPPFRAMKAEDEEIKVYQGIVRIIRRLRDQQYLARFIVLEACISHDTAILLLTFIHKRGSYMLQSVTCPTRRVLEIRLVKTMRRTRHMQQPGVLEDTNTHGDG